MLYPTGERQYLAIDPGGPVNLEDITIPYLPKEQVVLLTDNSFVRVVTIVSDNITAYLLRKIAGSNPCWE